MSILGFTPEEIVALVRGVRGVRGVQEDSELDPAAAVEVFAEVAWSVFAEPGDRVAIAIVSALGARAGLEAMLDHASPERLHELLREHGEAELPLAELALAVDRWRPRVLAVPTVRAFEQAARYGLTVVLAGDEDWPRGFDALRDSRPLALWLRGPRERLGWLDRSVAIVGARAATGYGEHVAGELADGLTERGWTIVSGGAYGIDGAAHRAALGADGRTIAFLAGGLDRFYPSGNDSMLTRVVEEGLVISEVPCGTSPTRWRFLQRNRLLAAASRGTVVVEAGSRSGSLNTAGHAAEIGRPLGAVPGPITSAASAGCHRLLREYDADCITGVEDVLVMLGDSVEPQPTTVRASPEVVRLLDALSSRSARTPAVVARGSGLSLTETVSLLGLLELEGAVRQRHDGWLKAG